VRWVFRIALALGLALLVLVLAAFLFSEQRMPALISYLPTPSGAPPGGFPGVGAAASATDRRVATRAYMGGIPAHLTCAGIDPVAFDALMVKVDARIEAFEQAWSKYRAESTISRLNAAGRTFEVDPETAGLLAASREFTAASEGALDVTVEPVIALWKSAEARGQEPSDDEIALALAAIGPERWGVEGATVHREPGVRFDVNAIAEGAMADAVLSMFRDAGCDRAIVELGGDIALYRASGQPPFRIGVDDPKDTTRLFATLEVDAGAVDTAGDYNRFLLIAGRRYGHIVDPRTGRPVAPELVSVTVVAPTALIADAWDTALFVLGWDAARRVVEARPELEAVLVHHDGRVWVSKGLEGKVRFANGDQKR